MGTADTTVTATSEAMDTILTITGITWDMEDTATVATVMDTDQATTLMATATAATIVEAGIMATTVVGTMATITVEEKHTRTLQY